MDTLTVVWLELKNKNECTEGNETSIEKAWVLKTSLMKKLDTSSPNTNWQNDLLKDLEYIKAHKRYKMSSKTISPTALIGLILLAAARVALPLLFVTTAGNPSREKSIFEWIMT